MVEYEPDMCENLSLVPSIQSIIGCDFYAFSPQHCQICIFHVKWKKIKTELVLEKSLEFGADKNEIANYKRIMLAVTECRNSPPGEVR